MKTIVTTVFFALILGIVFIIGNELPKLIHPIKEKVEDSRLECKETEHKVNNGCEPNKKDCEYYKGGIGVQTWKGNKYGRCMKVKK